MLRLVLSRRKPISTLTVGAQSITQSKLASCDRRFVAAAALIVGLMACSAAHAQCVSTLGNNFVFADATPFAKGSAASSLVSVLNTVNTAFSTHSAALVSSPPNAKPDQQGGGVWARSVVGTIDNRVDGITTLTVEGVGPVPGNIKCHTATTQEFSGYQVGADFAKFNLGGTGANWHFGLTAGSFEANAKDVSPGATFSGDFSVPFVGIYSTLTQGNLFVEGLFRWDFFQNRISDAANGMSGEQFDARSTSLTVNAGYRLKVGGSNFFVEPSAGVVWSRMKVDSIDVPGTLLVTNPAVFPGVLQVGDIDSLLGRLSLRVGTSFVSGNLALQPFATASIFHEFAGDVTTTMRADSSAACIAAQLPPNCLPDFTGSLKTGRVDTYAQFGVGIAGQVIDTGWLGYVRVDVRTGENIDGVTGNIGLRYQF